MMRHAWNTQCGVSIFVINLFCFIQSLSQGHARKHLIQTNNLLLISPRSARVHILLECVTVHLPDIRPSDMITVYYRLCCESVRLPKYYQGSKFVLICSTSFFIWRVLQREYTDTRICLLSQLHGQFRKNAGLLYVLYATMSMTLRISAHALVIGHFCNYSLWYNLHLYDRAAVDLFWQQLDLKTAPSGKYYMCFMIWLLTLTRTVSFTSCGGPSETKFMYVPRQFSAGLLVLWSPANYGGWMGDFSSGRQCDCIYAMP
jgi:hypothetical protein